MTLETNPQVIEFIRKPGKIYAPILSEHNVTYVAIEKASLLSILLEREPNAPCEWETSTQQHTQGTVRRYIDTQTGI